MATERDPASISDRQRQVLDCIKAAVAERGYPPSVREIGEAVGLSSPSTVHSHLAALIEAGFIRRDPSKPRAIEVLVDDTEAVGTAPRRGDTVRDVPMLGTIAAGQPILAVEEVDQVLSLPVELVGFEPVFMLTVKGDSMIDAGILEGDLVVIRRQDDARDGEIVAALVDDEEATVKRLRRQDGRVILESENPAYHPMVFERDVRILGKVVSVLRRVH